MRTLKKTLCLVLALALILGTLGVSAAAKATTDFDNFTDKSSIKFTEAVEVLNALGIVQGRDTGAFDPNAIVNRAEAAKLVAYTILGATAADLLVAAQDPFTDVSKDAWFAGYVAFTTKQGITVGRGDGTFDPAAPVTGYELAKMLLVAIGYGVNDEFVGANWAVNVAKIAINKGVYDGNLTADFSKGATRDEAALYTFNALTKVYTVAYVPILGDYVYNDAVEEIVSGSALEVNEYETLGWEYYNLCKCSGTIDYDGTTKGMMLFGRHAKVSLKGLAGIDVFDSGYSGYVWTVYTAGTRGNDVHTNIASFYMTDTVVATTYNFAKSEYSKAPYASKYNEWWLNGARVESGWDVVKGSEVVVIKEADGDYKLIAFTPWVDVVTGTIVTKTVTSTGDLKGKNIVKIPGITEGADYEGNDFDTALTGTYAEYVRASNLSGYAALVKGDVVTVLKMDDGVYYFEKATAVTGNLTKQTRAGTEITSYVAGTGYTASGLNGNNDGVAADLVLGFDSQRAVDDYLVSDIFAWLVDLPVKNLNIYLDRGGYVIYVSDATVNTVGKYAVVLDAGYTYDPSLGGTGFTAQALILNTNGTTETIVTDKFYGNPFTLGVDLEISWWTDFWDEDYTGEWVYLTQTAKTGVYTVEDAGFAVEYSYITNRATMIGDDYDLPVDDATIFIVQSGTKSAGYTYTVYTGMNAVPSMAADLMDVVNDTTKVAKDNVYNVDVDLVYIPAAATGTAISFFVLDADPTSHETIEVTWDDGQRATDVYGIKVWMDGAEKTVYMQKTVYQMLLFMYGDAYGEALSGLYLENMTVNQFGFIGDDGPYAYNSNEEFYVWDWYQIDAMNVNMMTDEDGYLYNVANTVIYVYDKYTNTMRVGSVADLKVDSYFCCDFADFHAEYPDEYIYVPELIFVLTSSEVDIG